MLTVSFEQTSVNGEVWLPSRISVRAEARIAILKKMRAEIDITYREYRKFQADSKIVADSLESHQLRRTKVFPLLRRFLDKESFPSGNALL